MSDGGELGCLEDLLTPFQDLSQQAEKMFWGPWVLVQKVSVRRGAQGCGETLSLALQCPVVEGTRGEVEGQTFDDP